MVFGSIDKQKVVFPPVDILLVQCLNELLEVKAHDCRVSVHLGKASIDHSIAIKSHDH